MDLKDNKGVIFKNDKKTTDAHPDYRGEINVNGQHWEISLWVNTDKNGKKYFSASIKEPYVRPESAPAPAQAAPSQPATESDDNDPLPF